MLAIGSATEDNYKPITAAAIGYGHAVIAETPIDVNMAKQLNILITQMGLPADRVFIDPSVGAVGYGAEYAYTVMERLRLAALNQNDDMTQMPMICNLGKEAWRSKEARATEAEEPAWGDADQARRPVGVRHRDHARARRRRHPRDAAPRALSPRSARPSTGLSAS